MSQKIVKKFRKIMRERIDKNLAEFTSRVRLKPKWIPVWFWRLMLRAVLKGIV